MASTHPVLLLEQALRTRNQRIILPNLSFSNSVHIGQFCAVSVTQHNNAKPNPDAPQTGLLFVPALSYSIDELAVLVENYRNPVSRVDLEVEHLRTGVDGLPLFRVYGERTSELSPAQEARLKAYKPISFPRSQGLVAQR